MMKRFVFCFFLAFTGFTGCFSSISTEVVEGRVTLNGKPLENALVAFTPVEGDAGLPAFGRTNIEGKFKMTALQGSKTTLGAVRGSYKVTIRKEAPEREMTEAEIKKLDEKGVAPEIAIVSLIPEKYADASSSDLSAEILPGKNILKFELFGQ